MYFTIPIPISFLTCNALLFVLLAFPVQHLPRRGLNAKDIDNGASTPIPMTVLHCGIGHFYTWALVLQCGVHHCVCRLTWMPGTPKDG